MSFNIALSGISAAQADLDTTANNIANVGTVGFKESRAEFESVYANSLFSNAKTKVGDGVAVSTIAQQFHQGSLKFTENPLDLAIEGSGFFAISGSIDEHDLTYTRAGTFKLNKDNYMVDNNGNYLQGYTVDDNGESNSLTIDGTKPIQIPDTSGIPVATTEVKLSLNLDSRKPTLDPAKFDPNDETTYTKSTGVIIYDSLGVSQMMKTYYIKPDAAAYTGTNQWITFVTVGSENTPVDMWDTTTGSAASGSYGKDINSDGVADTTANLAQSTSDLQDDADNAKLKSDASTLTYNNSKADAVAKATDLKDAEDLLALTPTNVALQTAVSTAQSAKTAADKKELEDANIAAADLAKTKAADEAVVVAQGFENDAIAEGTDGSAVYTDASGNTHTGAVLTFDGSGSYVGSSPATLTLQSLGLDDPLTAAPTDGAGVLPAGASEDGHLTLTFEDPTARGESFTLRDASQDGLSVGRLTGVETGPDGLIQATYSNNTTKALARVALVRFANEQGLTQTGSTNWIASQNSGEPLPGEADSGSFGTIKSAALEQANVNLTTELVDLISAQRNFQANSRALEINNTLQQTILQIR